jgi:hypothetical protein
MEVETKKSFSLSPYTISFVSSNAHLAVCNLEVGDSLKMLCRVSLVDHFQSAMDVEVKISSLDSSVREQTALYIGRIRKILLSSLDPTAFEKTKLSVEIDVLQKKDPFDAFHHIINLVSVSLLLANVDLRTFFVASTCFLDAQGIPLSEGDVDPKKPGGYTQAFLCKDSANTDTISSFKIHGKLTNNNQMADMFRFLIASANVIGRKIVDHFAREGKGK